MRFVVFISLQLCSSSFISLPFSSSYLPLPFFSSTWPTHCQKNRSIMENHAPIFAEEAPTRPGRMTGFLTVAVLLAVGIVSFVVSRSTARAEVATVISMETPIMPVAPAFMLPNPEEMLKEPVVHAGLCPQYGTCRNSKFKGHCHGCVQCMKKCHYPDSIRCYGIYATECKYWCGLQRAYTGVYGACEVAQSTSERPCD